MNLKPCFVNGVVRMRSPVAVKIAFDDWTEWLNDLEANGAPVDELDDAFAHVEALDQYDEGGAIVRMSAHERTFACGRVDNEFRADDLPERARFLAGDLNCAYASGRFAATKTEVLKKKRELLNQLENVRQRLFGGRL